MFKMSKNLLIAACLSMAVSINALAIDLDTAKAQGLVGETPSGYLAAVKTPSAEVTALINDINAKRKAVYQKSAKQNNITLQAVEKLAGKKAIEKTEKGNFIQLNGQWRKK